MNKQKGTILITTLLLLAVVTIIAIGMAERQRIDIKRTSQLATAQQSYLYGKVAEIWAGQLLKKLPLDVTKLNNINILMQWPQKMPRVEIPGGFIDATLSDAEGEFYNLNNISEATYRQGFFNLLKVLLPDQNLESNRFLMMAIVSWILPLGKETDILSDQYYLSLSPPYRTAHKFFVSPSELRLIKGIDNNPKIYNLLIPYMIALPESTEININTASSIVLMAVGDGFSLNETQEIVQARAEKGGFKTVDEFLNLPIMTNHRISSDGLSIESRYFLLKTVVMLNNQQLITYTLLKRIKNQIKKTNDMQILWQVRGTL
jgi:general secretion pathway protein K